MKTYHNPIKTDGDFADPFVLRYNGRYYLYSTTPDIQCWTSTDLVSWEPEGAAIGEEFPGLVPFAPEIVYSNGTFYMYTSPSGHGHYVLEADRPTGPFRTVTENMGHAIDGNVFIDDDGRWYFYWAGDEGIWGCEMPSPKEFGTPVFTGVHMNGWTEGPFVTKRDGWYHMTLTGNHYLSAGYRINAAYSTDPLRGYKNGPDNPIVVNTSDGFLGLGHNCSVTGPDLTSTYMVYHNFNPDASRHLNIDRQVWNGQALQVLGPTRSAPLPASPDVACDWKDRSILGWETRAGNLSSCDGWGELVGDDAHALWSAASTSESFTSEINLATGTATATYGLSLTSPDGSGGLVLRVDSEKHLISIVQVNADGSEEQVADTRLPSPFKNDALHRWSMEHAADKTSLMLDGRLQATIPVQVPVGSTFGVFISEGTIRIGYCALTEMTPEEADRASIKAAPGRFWASLSGDARSKEIRNAASAFDSVRLVANESLRYRLHVGEMGYYVVSLTGEFAAGSIVAINVNGKNAHRVHVTEARRVVSAEFDFSVDEHELEVRSVVGEAELSLVTVTPSPGDATPVNATGELSGTGKTVLDHENWADFTITGTISVGFLGSASHGDVIFRATQLSEGGEGNDPKLGINFFLGYSVQLHNDRIVLARHSYDERILATAPIAVNLGASRVIVVRAHGSVISVDVDGTTFIRHDDALPHLFGKIGMRAVNAKLHAATHLVTQENGEQ